MIFGAIKIVPLLDPTHQNNEGGRKKFAIRERKKNSKIQIFFHIQKVDDPETKTRGIAKVFSHCHQIKFENKPAKFETKSRRKMKFRHDLGGKRFAPKN